MYVPLIKICISGQVAQESTIFFLVGIDWGYCAGSCDCKEAQRPDGASDVLREEPQDEGTHRADNKGSGKFIDKKWPHRSIFVFAVCLLFCCCCCCCFCFCIYYEAEKL